MVQMFHMESYMFVNASLLPGSFFQQMKKIIKIVKIKMNISLQSQFAIHVIASIVTPQFSKSRVSNLHLGIFHACNNVCYNLDLCFYIDEELMCECIFNS